MLDAQITSAMEQYPGISLSLLFVVGLGLSNLFCRFILRPQVCKLIPPPFISSAVWAVRFVPAWLAFLLFDNVNLKGLVLAPAFIGLLIGTSFSLRVYLSQAAVSWRRRAPILFLSYAVWGVTNFLLLIATLPRYYITVRSLIPAGIFLGLFFAACFWLLFRPGKVTASWWQRTLMGGGIGLALMPLAVVLIRFRLGLPVMTSPGDGYHWYPVYEDIIFASIIVPIFAVAGVATPRVALVSSATKAR